MRRLCLPLSSALNTAMQIPSEKKVCKRCGLLVSENTKVTLPNLLKLQIYVRNGGKMFSPEGSLLPECVKVISEAANISNELAAEYILHEMGNCQKTYPPCPSCGLPLKNWHSKLCLNCNWHKNGE
jgi:uncharacterized membrane protein YhaH (DUF805 family)